ncbi:MAG: TetR/AcrR family transcriptional regulator [Pseudomonadota bacterium]
MSSLLDYIELVDATESASRRGRPRSDKATKAVLDSVHKLLLTNPVRDVSIEGIARKAKVGKTTIYRWWPSKVAIILDMLNTQIGDMATSPRFDTHAEAVQQFMDRFLRLVKGRNGKILIETLAEAQADADALTLFYERFMLQHEQKLASLIEAGKKSGEFRQSIDTGMAVDMIVGAVVYRLQSGADTLDADFVSELPQQAVHLLSAR